MFDSEYSCSLAACHIDARRYLPLPLSLSLSLPLPLPLPLCRYCHCVTAPVTAPVTATVIIVSDSVTVTDSFHSPPYPHHCLPSIAPLCVCRDALLGERLVRLRSLLSSTAHPEHAASSSSSSSILISPFLSSSAAEAETKTSP